MRSSLAVADTSPRTHRERKELYVKALEDEVLRLKEIFSNVSQDKVKVSEENKQLRQLLAQNGIAIHGLGSQDDISSVPGGAYTSSASPSGYSHTRGGSQSLYTPPLTSKSSAPSTSPSYPPTYLQPGVAGRQTYEQNNIDLEQAGIDFVLA